MKRPPYSLIDDLLAEQAQLTAVERFSQRHEGNIIPLRQKFYHDLIPLSLPRPGEQFAFEVNLDACSGCKACVTACHNLNGLDEGEAWREVGALRGGSLLEPINQTVTTACHHCLEPGCLSGCPVEAYEKSTVTGIVRHLDDQCIGCQYCTMMCPYDVPKYSHKRGIVRKCDMCQSRLAVGEAPACVQSCPNGAISIQIVSRTSITDAAAQNRFLPDAPSPAHTRPTTHYKSVRPLPSGLKAGDHYELKPAVAHPPLIVMLILTQLSVGLFALDYLARLYLRTPQPFSLLNIVIAAATGAVGIGASMLHLGRPLHAWRAFLGWKTSWLSREIMSFGGFGAAAGLYVACAWMPHPAGLQTALGLAVVLTGLASIACSVMVYQATHREFWQFSLTATRFYGTALILGSAFLWAMAARFDLEPVARASAGLLVFSSSLKLAIELFLFQHLKSGDLTAMKRSALLMRGALGYPTNRRFLFGALGGIVLPAIWFVALPSPGLAIWGCVLCLFGEFSERYLFFAAVAPPKMPGGS